MTAPEKWSLNTDGWSGDQAERMSFSLPTGTDPASIRARVEAMEFLLERSFRVPGVNIPVGLDSLIGLVPVIGDIITTAMGAYIVWEARNLGLSKWQLTRMGANVAVDARLETPTHTARTRSSRCRARYRTPSAMSRRMVVALR